MANGGGGKMEGRTDVWKFHSVSYRTSAFGAAAQKRLKKKRGFFERAKVVWPGVAWGGLGWPGVDCRGSKGFCVLVTD